MIDGNSKRIDTEVNIFLARVTASKDQGFFRLQITDNRSKNLIIEANIPIDKIADLVSSRQLTAPAKFYRSLTTGKYMEQKTIHVPLDGDVAGEVAMATVRKFVSEHWKGWTSYKVDLESYSYRNANRINDTQFYSLRIFRYVPGQPVLEQGD